MWGWCWSRGGRSCRRETAGFGRGELAGRGASLPLRATLSRLAAGPQFLGPSSLVLASHCAEASREGRGARRAQHRRRHPFARGSDRWTEVLQGRLLTAWRTNNPACRGCLVTPLPGPPECRSIGQAESEQVLQPFDPKPVRSLRTAPACGVPRGQLLQGRGGAGAGPWRAGSLRKPSKQRRPRRAGPLALHQGQLPLGVTSQVGPRTC